LEVSAAVAGWAAAGTAGETAGGAEAAAAVDLETETVEAGWGVGVGLGGRDDRGGVAECSGSVAGGSDSVVEGSVVHSAKEEVDLETEAAETVEADSEAADSEAAVLEAADSEAAVMAGAE
tara:strand:+ start:7349 stop:7711 length:363 start_codon:yes stop_codon:yes gene_type:complete